MTIPTKPTKPTVPPAPQRGENPVNFSNKINAFVLFYSTLADYTDASLDWQQTVYTATGQVYDDTVVQRQLAEQARDLSLAYRDQANSYRQETADNAAIASAAVQAVADGQEQVNLLLGAGIGTTFLQDGELYINYAEAVVSDVSINQDGVLVITGI